MAQPSSVQVQPAVGLFLRTDEECDIAQFRGYLATLSPEALWDVVSHLDRERYPRRSEAIRRELALRRLFFVVPYTRRELQMRAFLGAAVFWAVFAALLHLVAQVTIDLAPCERLPFFTDLAVGSPQVARLLLSVVLPLAKVGAMASAATAPWCLFLAARRRLRADIAVLAVLTPLVVAFILHLVDR